MLKKCHHDGLDQHEKLIKGHGIVDMDVGISPGSFSSLNQCRIEL